MSNSRFDPFFDPIPASTNAASSRYNRRSFLQSAAKTAALAAAATRIPNLLAESTTGAPARRSPNDTIQLALIGAGIQGQFDTGVARQVPG
ncbi:MAG: hypothetical protein HIU93_14575, partial [Acidobacteria bacterium]|nr:hypothetical protein [Acidobacteriota bacterium]